MTETAGSTESVPGTSQSPLPSLELQPASPPSISDHHSSAHLLRPGCTPEFTPYTTHTTANQVSLTSCPLVDHKPQAPPCSGTRRIRRYSFDEFYLMKDPPSYDEALQSIDLSSLQNLKYDETE